MGRPELEVVAENLRLWQTEIQGQRRYRAPEALIQAAAREREKMGAEWQLDWSRLQDERERRQSELEGLYGDAVDQVEGAELQDLLILDEIGALLLEVNPDADLRYFTAKILGEEYLASIRKPPSPL